VTAGNPGIGVSGVTVLSGTQMAATFTIGTGAGLGVSNITVTASGGTSGTVGFTVNAAPGSITATSGTPQGAVFYTEFAPLVATVKDAAGNPVAGAAVRFQAPEDGSGCHFEANWSPASAQARRPRHRGARHEREGRSRGASGRQATA